MIQFITIIITIMLAAPNAAAMIVRILRSKGGNNEMLGESGQVQEEYREGARHQARCSKETLRPGSTLPTGRANVRDTISTN